MPIVSIDPVENYYRVATSLVGRVVLFFSAGWCGLFLARLSVAIDSWRALVEPQVVLVNIFGSGFGIIGELLALVFWPVSTAGSSAEISVWFFFFAMMLLAVVFAVFVYSEEPAPAWWLGLTGFVAVVHVVGVGDAALFSWLVLLTIVVGLGAALWWSLLVWHPELVESVSDLFRGRSSRPGYSQIRKQAPPGTWQTRAEERESPDPPSWRRAGRDD